NRDISGPLGLGALRPFLLVRSAFGVGPGIVFRRGLPPPPFLVANHGRPFRCKSRPPRHCPWRWPASLTSLACKKARTAPEICSPVSSRALSPKSLILQPAG